jgi:hypothetical protein
MSVDPYAFFKYDDLKSNKVAFATRDGLLLVTITADGGQGGASKFPGQKSAFAKLLSELVKAWPDAQVAGVRFGNSETVAVRNLGRLAACESQIVEHRREGGAYRFDFWLRGITDTVDALAKRLGLVPHEQASTLLWPKDFLDILAAEAPSRGQTPDVSVALPAGTPLPKAFVLLAGLSGTGKTSFVREQAARMTIGDRNLVLIPVRPDWHEPSELLGHLSRINGERFVATPFLKFIASAWRDAAASATAERITLRPLDAIPTFWACLDEMNLAPVEQYFADYLSVLETRHWEGDQYTCEAILPLHRHNYAPAVLDDLRRQLDLAAPAHDGLWLHFTQKGIPLPPNLVVAGTVNMDETTHGFSRKVIDRAFTVDFGAFFPTHFGDYFEPSTRAVTFTFPRRSKVARGDLAGCFDADGQRTITFLDGINAVLRGTAFELAYRALNELLLAVQAFAPRDEAALRAVWDDFLMTKVLPRLEGDAEKLKLVGEASLLTQLRQKALTALGADKDAQRPDLFRTTTSGDTLSVTFRAPIALARMHERLTRHNFTSFWP